MPAKGKAPARCAMKSCTPATELLTSAQAPNQMMQQPQIARRVLILRARLALERRVPACSAARTCVSLRSIVEGSIANAVAPLANMTWRTFIDIFADEFAEHPNGKKAVLWLRECVKGLNEEDRYQINFRLRLAHKRARRAAAEPETEDEASDSEPEDGKRKAPPPSPSMPSPRIVAGVGTDRSGSRLAQAAAAGPPRHRLTLNSTHRTQSQNTAPDATHGHGLLRLGHRHLA